jgi:hypothetical protein
MRNLSVVVVLCQGVQTYLIGFICKTAHDVGEFNTDLFALCIIHSAFWRPDATVAPLRGQVNLGFGLKSHHTRNKSKILYFLFSYSYLPY